MPYPLLLLKLAQKIPAFKTRHNKVVCHFIQNILKTAIINVSQICEINTTVFTVLIPIYKTKKMYYYQVAAK